MKKVSFVIPCYRSEKTLEAVVKEITEAMLPLQEYEYEIILVNDGSPDHTMSTIEHICEENKSVIGVDLAKNFGQHSALMAGYSLAAGDVVISLDDDGQTPACEVGKLLDKIEEGYDVVYARYELKKHSAFRNFGTLMNLKMTELLLGKPKDLFISSYFAAKRFIIDEMLKYRNAFPYVEGLILRTTDRICNVTVCHRSRMEGESGYSFRKLLALWLNGFTAFSVIPLRMATYTGLAVAACGFIFTIYTVIRKIVDPYVTVGWSSLVAIMLFLGGLLLVMLGLVGEYIGRIYISINNSPQYVMRRIIGQEDNRQ